jgi:predicted RNase H-like HicB family nuclease
LESSLMSIADELELAARKLRRVASLRMSREEAQRRIEEALRIMHQSYVRVRAREES